MSNINTIGSRLDTLEQIVEQNKNEMRNEIIDVKNSNDAENDAMKIEMDENLQKINDRIKEIEEIVKNAQSGNLIPQPLNADKTIDPPTENGRPDKDDNDVNQGKDKTSSKSEEKCSLLENMK